MRARRVAILLALTAVSILTLFVLVLIDGEALGATAALPDTLAVYEENVLIGPDGDAQVEVRVVLTEGGSGDLLLPFSFVDGHDFTILSGPARFAADETGAAQPLRRVLGHLMLNLITDPMARAGDEVRVQAAIPGWFQVEESRRPYGEFAVRRDFVNRSGFFLRELHMGVRLPDGMRVHAIPKVVPAYDAKKNPQPPFAVGVVDGHGTAHLTAANLQPADAVRMDILFRPVRRGPIPLIVGLALAVLYLLFFRDVLKPTEGK